jgi:hypothetical protein
MGRRARTLDAQPFVWTEGRIRAMFARGLRSEVVDLALRIDTLSISVGDAPLCAFDRDELRLWLARPAGRLAVDDVELSAEGTAMVLTAGERRDVLPGHVETHLRMVV